MRALKLGLGLAAIVAIAGQPAASAQRLVPPGNSAANQYTETLPAAGGNAPTGGGGAPSPAKALGTRNAGRLEALGPQGQAAATLAATTAPAPSVARRGVAGSRGGADGRNVSGSRGAPENGGGPGAGTSQPNGSSGLSQVIEQATGSSSSGQMGLLLPLIILAAVAWSVAYLWRRRRTTSQ